MSNLCRERGVMLLITFCSVRAAKSFRRTGRSAALTALLSHSMRQRIDVLRRREHARGDSFEGRARSSVAREITTAYIVAATSYFGPKINIDNSKTSKSCSRSLTCPLLRLSMRQGGTKSSLRRRHSDRSAKAQTDHFAASAAGLTLAWFFGNMVPDEVWEVGCKYELSPAL
jgi:hypothetical protein